MNGKEQLGGFFLLPVVMMLLAACDAVPPSEATSRPDLLSEPATIPVLTEAPRVGHMAPDFVLQTLDGREARLSDYRGHVVFLNFWATWCGPCRVEMPAIEQLYRELRPKGFAVLAVSTDPEGPTVTRPYRDALGLTFTIAHDPEMQVGRLFGVRALPLTFVVDRHGVITHHIFGSRDWTEPEARNGIRKLLLIR
jgi:peroxiredoxin